MSKRCLICEKELKPDVVGYQQATVWTTEGGYGSTIYDPMNGDVHLEAVICDDCLTRKKALIEEVVTTRPPEVEERRRPAF